jgi:ABC-2 type transport system permease protein
MFEVSEIKAGATEKEISEEMNERDALVALVIPKDFSEKITQKAQIVSQKALNDFGLEQDTGMAVKKTELLNAITLYYHPVLQESFRYSIQGALRSSLQIVESKQISRLEFNVKSSSVGFGVPFLARPTRAPRTASRRKTSRR